MPNSGYLTIGKSNKCSFISKGLDSAANMTSVFKTLQSTVQHRNSINSHNAAGTQITVVSAEMTVFYADVLVFQDIWIFMCAGRR